MDIRIIPRFLCGTIDAIPSKSAAHRLLICSALADRPTILRLPSTSEDIEATIRCLSDLGAQFAREKDGVTVTPIPQNKLAAFCPVLDCGESGSTLRFLLPVACALYDRVEITGCGSLPHRPIGELLTALEMGGVHFSSDTLPFKTAGRLQSGSFSLPGNISSQYISGILLALPLLEGHSSVNLTTTLESKAYVRMTQDTLRQFEITIDETENSYICNRKAAFHSPGTIAVEGDWSAAAFFLCAGALGVEITLCGLSPDSKQADKAILACLRKFGASTEWQKDSLTIHRASMHGITLDLSEFPDLLPALAVIATQAEGETHFVHCERLRYKESDRIVATASMLKSLGACVELTESGITVHRSNLSGGRVDGFGDHRIVMAAAIAALCCTGSVTISGAEAVAKSYPDFFRHYQSLGGKNNVL